MLKRQTEDEKEAKRLEKERREHDEAARKAAETAAKEERKEQERLERDRQEFLKSPAGQARTAFERGDPVFQFSIDVQNTQAVVIPMVTAMTNTKTTDPIAVLNSVCNEGWDLVNGSFVFHETGSESRDKFLASGQNIAVRGTVIGYYRSEQEAVAPIWSLAAVRPGQRSALAIVLARFVTAAGRATRPAQHEARARP